MGTNANCRQIISIPIPEQILLHCKENQMYNQTCKYDKKREELTTYTCQALFIKLATSSSKMQLNIIFY